MNTPKTYKHDPTFRALARKKQSDFRELVLKCDFDADNPRAQYGNLLKKEDAIKGLNFYSGFRKEIMHAIGPYKSMLWANLLRSEHIPWNVFFPMSLTNEYLENCKHLFNVLVGHEFIQKIDAIDIERPFHYLNDHTSFDTYISYTHVDGQKGGIGIEVKYTEEAYHVKPSSTEYKNVISLPSKEYTETTVKSGYYIEPMMAYESFKTDEFRQLWRNHILGASVVLHGEIGHFLMVHLYPSFNEHFQKVLPRYQAFLTSFGQKSFFPLTFEHLFQVMRASFQGEEDNKWINYLVDRYLF